MPDYKRYQYGATLGGPIIKDKTFFFATFEGVNQKSTTSPLPFVHPGGHQQRRRSGKDFLRQVWVRLPPAHLDFVDANGDGVMDYGRGVLDYTNTLTSYSAGLKIDHIFNEKDRVAFRWLYNYNTYKDGLPYYWVPGKQLERPHNYHTGGLTWLHLFSPTAYNEVRIGFHREHWEEKIQDPDMAGFGWFDDRCGWAMSGTPCTRTTRPIRSATS